MANANSAIASVRYIEADHSWEGPLLEVLLYTLMYLTKFKQLWNGTIFGNIYYLGAIANTKFVTIISFRFEF